MISFRLLDCDHPAAALASAVSSINKGLSKSHTYIVDPSSFRKVPNAPFAYWVSDRIRQLFTSLPSLEGNGRTAKLGASTKNDFRFLRLAWETPLEIPQRSPWRLYAKGGAFSTFYSDVWLQIKWVNNAREIEAELLQKFPYLGGNAEFVLHRDYPHLSPGLTWPPRTQRGLGMRALPAGCVFGNKGPAVFLTGDDHQNLCELLAITTSDPFCGLVEIQMAFGSYEVGVVQRTVLPQTSNPRLATLARAAWSTKHKLDTTNLTSHAFGGPILTRSSTSIKSQICAWESALAEASSAITEIQSQINDIAFELYGFCAEDRKSIEQMLHGTSLEDVSDRDEDDSDVVLLATDAYSLVSELMDFCVGAAFGRWDIGHASKHHQHEPFGPFDPLPLCPPGMLLNGEGLPAEQADVPIEYPIAIPWHGILVADRSNPEDIESRVSNVLEVAWGDKMANLKQEACSFLGVETLNEYFQRPAAFFSEHVKRHSRSRRQAPIYWLISAGSSVYSVWLYYHRFTKDTLYRALRDFVGPRIKQAEREQFELESQGVLSGDAAARLQEAQALLQDLRIFKSEIDLVAPLWNPNLNDGVIINHAIL
jgi:hypothetical protein